MNADVLRRKFDEGADYEAFVASGAPMGHRDKWDMRYGQLELDDAQRALVGGFARPIKVLCLTGTWCGDCALQGAAMQRVAEGSDQITLRFIPRSDEHAEFIVPNRINAGFRVPVTFFLAEDFEPVSRIGDRTLSRYRSMARKALGDDAVVAPAPPDPVRAVLQEVIDEFERVHLLLRTSARWRQKYGD